MNAKLFTLLGLALALGACVSGPRQNDALDNARVAVRTAEADPNVSKYAALDLDAAKRDLEVAERAALHGNGADIAEPAYLATQNARLAQVHAAAKADDARVAAGQTERDRIMLDARTREAENAKASANAARDQRDQATEESARSAANAARSQQDATRSQEDAARSQESAAIAQAETARVQAELDELKARPTPRGLVMTLGDVLFNTGRAELNSGAQRKMEQLAQFLNEHPDRRVKIEGFTDSVGTDSYNEELSQHRADAVKNALLSRGVASSRIDTEGYGKAYPVANNTDSGGRQLNRRVEVVIGGNHNSPISPRG